MSNPTSNFGWQMPTATDLVTDLPADFEVFGQAVDTDFVDLLGGTTGQVLSKTSATDLDFTWTTPTDQTPLTTKGDLFTFTTVDARLGIGANNTILTADSAQATGMKWATPAVSTGKLIQVINATFGTAVSTSSATFSDTGLTVSITPTLNTSKILIQAEINGIGKSNVLAGVALRLMRNSTSIIQFEEIAAFQADVNNNDVGGSGTTFLDSPATTSATTYKVQFACYNATGSARINRIGTGTTSSITVMEIGA